jgi:uncharacterized protein YbbC (DUF1343 family)
MSDSAVIPGIDFFQKDSKYRTARLGLITNPSGITSDGVPTWKALLENGFSVTALFGPEHGFRGEAQDAVHLGDETFQGIKTYSLYGENLKPTKAMLNEIDIMVFDIQEVGSRYYTYLYTLAYCLEACSRLGKRFVVLDRPNPIGADIVEGGPIDQENASFVGGFGLANRYGMTIGEYGRYLQGEYFPKAELEVVQMEGYRRAMFFSETDLPWVAPSPNLPTLGTALVYPGTCLFEGTNLSEGRGTTRPFETIGAPWLDGESLRESLGQMNLPGVIFMSTFFTPVFSKHTGHSCQGVVVHVSNPKYFQPLRTAVAMLWLIKQSYPDHLEWRKDWEGNFSFLDRLAGGRFLREMLDAGDSFEQIYDRACLNQSVFQEKRDKYRIYS